MASNTQQTRNVREAKRAARGSKRKAAVRTKGSTRSYEELFGQPKAAKTED